MKFAADLHLHSKYSRAVSQQMTFPNMARWARLKGISVLATGDFTHPFWLEAIKVGLEEIGNGLLRLKTNDERSLSSTRDERLTPKAEQTIERQEIYFLLSCEVSSIYSQGGRARRIHNLFMFPTVEAVDKFNEELLKRRANLRSDGRPIVGISSKDLAYIALECSEKALIVPAHIWTPWFSLFGSFSGFDSVGECFGDMAKYIYGIETGLSSDPLMNWQIDDLDGRAILSFSDAHSLQKMGREATVFGGEEISYNCIYNAIRNVTKVTKESRFASEARRAKESNVSAFDSSDQSDTSDFSRIAFTIEFHPEEGKYHFTGHRNCNFSQGPSETAQNGDKCPVCKRSLTVGVMDRVNQLSSREIPNVKSQVSNGVKWFEGESGRPPYVKLVPLLEVLAEAVGTSPGSQKVGDLYMRLVNIFGSEFNVLLKADLEKIARFSDAKICDAIKNVRLSNIVVEPGYDGRFGIVKIWQNGDSGTEENKEDDQLNLFV